MSYLIIIEIVFLALLLILGVETFIKIKKSAGKQIDEVRKPLMLRIDIIMVLTVLIAVLTVVNIVLRR